MAHFEFVCSTCLASRDVLAAPALPEACPTCGTVDPWSGPIVRMRFQERIGEGVFESPFYLAASRVQPGDDPSGLGFRTM